MRNQMKLAGLLCSTWAASLHAWSVRGPSRHAPSTPGAPPVFSLGPPSEAVGVRPSLVASRGPLAAANAPYALENTASMSLLLQSAPNKTKRRAEITSPVSKSPNALLTRVQEAEMTFAIRRFRAAVRMRDQLSRMNMQEPPTELEWAQACGMTVLELRKVMQLGQEAREVLVAANAGLVTSIAKRHYHALKQASQSNGPVLPCTLQDLIQEGNVGILAAAERFEPEKGFRFGTYATWWIRQRILRSISDSGRIIRLPAHVHSTLQRIYKVRKELTTNLGREPSLSELAGELNTTVSKLQRFTDSSRHVVSLELPLRAASFRDDRRTLGDVLASDAPSPEEDVQAEYLKRDIQAVMNELAERERHVIEVRFGLHDGKPRTHAETAKLLGISRDRVRLVEARALNKLRSPQRNYRLKEYVVSSQSHGSFSSLDSSSSQSFSATASSTTSSGHDRDLKRPRASERIWFF